MGYAYIGPQSFYKLHLAELYRLKRGYELWRGAQEPKARPGGRGRVRESDLRRLHAYDEKIKRRRGVAA